MKKDIDAKCYELTLTPNYVSDWTFNDALRELIQNGTDQEVLDKENEFQIIYNGKEKTLRLLQIVQLCPHCLLCCFVLKAGYLS